MKECPVNKNCVDFETIGELEKAFEEMAAANGKKLGDGMTVEGNSGLTFGEVKIWIQCFGVENIYFYNGFKNGFIDEFYFDLKNSKYDGHADFSGADEVSIANGFLRVWFD
jgi:hypothetical protein